MAPPVLKVPLAQGKQLLAPVVPMYSPAGQAVQEAAVLSALP